MRMNSQNSLFPNIGNVFLSYPNEEVLKDIVFSFGKRYFIKVFSNLQQSGNFLYG